MNNVSMIKNLSQITDNRKTRTNKFGFQNLDRYRRGRPYYKAAFESPSDFTYTNMNYRQ